MIRVGAESGRGREAVIGTVGVDVTGDSSRNSGATTTFQGTTGCPRCGVRLDSPYKYCPNCSYRLRPDLARHHLAEAEPIRTSQRILALGGYLGFVSLLLLLVLVGMQLFADDPPPAAEPMRNVVADVQATFRAEELIAVAGGDVAWGVHRPEASSGDLLDLLRSMPDSLVPAVEGEAAKPPVGTDEQQTWVRDTYEVLEARTRAIMPDIYRVDDAFSIGITEITQEQWFAFLVARSKRSGRVPPKSFYPRSWTRASRHPQVARIYSQNQHAHPVTDIDFVAALEFCNWVWAESFDSDPDLVVDLPTAFEFTSAGRATSLDNFPWSSRLIPDSVVLEGRLQPTRRKAVVGYYRGIYALVGNAAEWVHYGYDCAAMGWSYLDSARRRDADRNEWRTPFSNDSVEAAYGFGSREKHVGFRIVLRRAPSMPNFVAVTAGTAQFVSRPNPILPPVAEVRNAAGNFVFMALPPVDLPRGAHPIDEPFEIGATEITNRQYLRFLASMANRGDEEDAAAFKQRIDALVPRSFGVRVHPFSGRATIFAGPWGRPDVITRLYNAGHENHPVRSVNPTQAQAYAHWLTAETGQKYRLPTVEQFVRAGRGDATAPYPWGDSTGNRELICDGRADDLDRAVSVRYLSAVASTPGAVVGLCGNVMELVRDDFQSRWLLAGGCYEFEPKGCTLDSFLEWGWTQAQIWSPTRLEEEPLLIPFALPQHTGFRLVRKIQGR